MEQSQVPELTQVGSAPDIWKFMRYGLIDSEAKMSEWVDSLLKLQEAGSDLPFTVVHLPTGRIAGATRYLNISQSHRSVEIGGTWYGLEFQRTMVNTEAKYLLLAYAFEKLACVRVQFKTDLRNERSQRAIERLGAVREGVLRNHMILPDGSLRSSVIYSILSDEWPQIKTRLTEMINQPARAG
jgi:RimJ/RimL family protein N-acetyltransferase